MTEILSRLTQTDEMQCIRHASESVAELIDIVGEETQGESELSPEWQEAYKRLRMKLVEAAALLHDLKTDPTLIESSRVRYTSCIFTDTLRDEVAQAGRKIGNPHQRIIFEEEMYRNGLNQLRENRSGELIQPDREYYHDSEAVERAQSNLSELSVSV